MQGGGLAAGPRGGWVQAFCLALLLQLCFEAASDLSGVSRGFEASFDYFSVDLRMRYNEVECSHTGLNPYHVWAGEVESGRYKPWYRPDKLSYAADAYAEASGERDGMLPVVAYPPWHTTLFWWYPSLQKTTLIVGNLLLHALLGVGLFLYLLRWRPGTPLGDLMYLGCIGLGVAFPFMHCFEYLNYGNLLILLFIIIYEAHKWGERAVPGWRHGALGRSAAVSQPLQGDAGCEAGGEPGDGLANGSMDDAVSARAGRGAAHPRAIWVASQVVQGLALVFVMLKPQIGVLLSLPLLAGRRFLAVGLAAVICVLLTLFPAHVYGESPLELILQIPKFGAPYALFAEEWQGFAKYVGKYLGPLATVGWSVIIFALCAALSLAFRRHPSVLVRFLPAALLFPVFGYANLVDFGLLWPVLLFLVLTLLGRGPVLLSGRDCLGLSLLFLFAQLPAVLDLPLTLFARDRLLTEVTKNHIVAGLDTFAFLMHALMAALLALRLWQARGQPPNPAWVERPW